MSDASRTGDEQTLRELREENARLWEEVHRLRAERREVAYYENLATQLTTSASWRVTKPLRLGKWLAAWGSRKAESARNERRRARTRA